jgi:phosphodiesterase/alkaline phosphatase D-like protein
MSIRDLRVTAVAGVLCVFGVVLVWCSVALAQYGPGEPAWFGAYSGPGGVAVDQAHGYVYVGNEGGGTVDKVGLSGEELDFSALGSSRLTVPGGTPTIYQVAVDNSKSASDPSKGDIYVADYGDKVVYRYKETGELDGEITGLSIGAAVAVDSAGNVYVAQYSEGDVLAFSPTGTALNSGEPVLKGLVGPNALAFDSHDNIYVAQRPGTFEFKANGLGGFEEGSPKQFGGESFGVAVDQETGDVFADQYTGIEEFDESGTLVGIRFGEPSLSESNSIAIDEVNEQLYATSRNQNLVYTYAPEIPTAPGASTGAASELQETSAILNGTVDPHGLETTYEFELWEKTEAEAQKIPATPQTVGSGFAGVSVSQTILTLMPNTTYHYRVVAKNTLGSTDGTAQSFETPGPKPPSALTGTASEITETSALLNGEVNPQRLETTYEFEWWEKTEAEAQKVPGSPVTVGSGFEGVMVSQAIHGLTGNTVYHYRVVAKNALGSTDGTVQVLQTTIRPTVTTLLPGAITVDSATVGGTVDPNGLATDYSVEYGVTDAYGQSLPLIPAGMTHGTQTVSPVLEDLTPNTTYHYRVVAFNEDGASYGEDRTLTTAHNPAPLAVTLAAGEVTQNAATLNGTVNPDGQRTRYEFQIGTNTDYGASVFFDAGSGQETENVTLTISSLQPGTTYHYRLVAINEGGSSEGADQTFTTTTYPSATLTAPPTPSLLATPPTTFPTTTTNTAGKTTGKTTKKTKSNKKKKTKTKKKTKKHKR